MSGINLTFSRLKFYQDLIVFISILLLFAARYSIFSSMILLSIAAVAIFLFSVDKKVVFSDKALLIILTITSGILPYFFKSLYGLNFNYIIIFYVLLFFCTSKLFNKIFVQQLLVFSFFFLYLIIQNFFITHEEASSSSIFAQIVAVAPFLLIIGVFNSKGAGELVNVLKYSFFILGVDLALTYLLGEIQGLAPIDIELNANFAVRISGVGIQTNQLAAWICILLPFIHYSNASKSDNNNFWFLFFLILIVLLTGSRFGLGAVTLFLIFFFINSHPKLILSAVLIIGIFSSIVFLTGIYEDFALFAKLISGFEQGDDIRFSKYFEFITIFTESPIFGIGHAMYPYYSQKIGGDGFNTHNGYLSILSEYGIFGFLFYVTIFCIVIKYVNSKKLNPQLTKAIYFSLIIFFLYGFFDTFHGTFYFYIYLGLLISSVSSY